ncbi:MAG: heparinase II/III family protein [Rhodospirillales bacterium]
MALTLGGRPVGQQLSQAWYRLRLPLFASPLYRAMLGGPPAFQLAVAPPDPWPGDADRGASILAGTFPLAHEVLSAQGELIWDKPGASREWLDELHSFGWLSDLRTLGGGAARRRARELVAGWCRRYRWWDAAYWRPGVLAHRVAAWLGHYEFFAASADDELRARFFRALLRQLRHLDRVADAAPDPIDRLAAAKALAMAGIALPDDAPRLSAGLRRLEKILTNDFLADGGHASRSPLGQVKALRHLVDIRAALGAANRSIPDALQSQIEALAAAVRFLRHGDGGLALFNGANEGENWLIDTLLAHAVPRAALPPRLASSGYERLQAGRSVAIMDVGGPPPPGFDADAHAGALSFELSIGKERLIVNTGAAIGPDAQRRLKQRGTAAHSTVVVADSDSAPLGQSGRFAREPGIVSAQREERDGAALIDARHDLYLKRFGLRHRRRLYMAPGGEDVRGEDTLDGPADVDFAAQFHLHPGVDATLLQGGSAALLRLPGGAGWRMRGAGAAMALAESVYFGDGGEMKRSHRLVLSGKTGEGGETVVKWALQREARPREAKPREAGKP